MLRSLIALSLLVPCVALAQDSPEPDGTTLDRAAVETIVREYLLANPEVLEEAFSALQAKREAQAASERAASLEAYRQALEHSPHGAILGNPDGDVTLVEFFDYNCGYCRRALEDMHQLLEADPNLRVVLKEFPVLGQPSMEAAAVSIAVNEVAPDAFLEFHERLLATDGPVDQQVALDIAEEMALPLPAVKASMRSDTVQATVEESYEIAQALGLSGTPSYVIGDAVEFGAVGFDVLQTRIDEARCDGGSC